MNLEQELLNLTDDVLLSRTHSVAKKEQELTLSLLFHLKEVNRRRSYAVLGCSSLWEYTVKVLGYGESAASERIGAMKLLSQVPEVKEKIETGKLTLTTAAQAQRFFQAEEKVLKKKYTVEQKQDVLSQIEGCSKREVEKKLLSISPEQAEIPARVEKMRVVTEEKTELKLLADKELMAMITRVKQIRGSEMPLAEMFKLSLREWLKKNDPQEKIEKKQIIAQNDSMHGKASQNQSAQKDSIKTQPKLDLSLAGQTRKNILLGESFRKVCRTRYISSAVKKQVLTRAQGQCEYRAPNTGMRCASRTRLQFEHKHRHALGGGNELSNIELLCFGHNQRRAFEVFGSSPKLNVL